MMFADAMQQQATFCRQMGAPITATVCTALARAMDTTSETGRRVIGWRGDMLADALPLRLAAPFHALYRAHRAASLVPLFEGHDTDGVGAVREAVAAQDLEIAGWLDGPPQTNEPGRSATFMAALAELAKRFGRAFELLEIGSSAGLNLLIDRFGYRLGGARFGPKNAPVVMAPAWRGAALDQAEVRITSARGVDIAPLDVRLPGNGERLLAYVWIDTPERVTRVEQAIAMIVERPVDLAQGDAADWIEDRLREPQAPGTTRVLMHSVVWRYLPPGTQRRVTDAMSAAGAAATLDRPLAWIAFEQDDFSQPHRIRLRVWPGADDTTLGDVTLGIGHPHGTWIDWSG